MNLQYLPDDILNNIFLKLSYHDMIRFSQVKQSFHKNYYDIIKYNIFYFVNRDSKLFRECLRRFKYSMEEIDHLRILCVP